MNLDNPREKVITSMISSLPEAEWEQNSIFVHSLKEKISVHPFKKNKILTPLSSGMNSFGSVKEIHLEYKHAIVQIFTDALLMAQLQTRQLEPRLSAGTKMGPRFLLTLNTLDEFGFIPGLDTNNYYQGNHKLAHYNLFEELLNDLDIPSQERNDYTPSVISVKVRAFLEAAYDDYASIVALLAVAEEQVILFSPPLRNAVANYEKNVTSGYYRVHGTTTDEETDGADDDHENDLWAALTQACRPKDYERITSLCLEYCDLWNEFWDYQHQLHSSYVTSSPEEKTKLGAVA